MESGEAGLFAEHAHLECCTEVSLLDVCFICTWPVNSPFLFVCVIFLYCITDTAIFIMVVSPAVLAHDVSAPAGDVLMWIAVFPIGWIYSESFEKLGEG